MVHLTRQDEIFILDLGDGDNRFDGDSLPAINAALDEVAAHEGPGALVTTASGKTWSNGLDLDYVMSLGDDFPLFVRELEATFARVLELPVFSVAALQGHTFAGGAMFALAHDVRIMRSDRGYFCLPEVDLGLPFTEGMAALISAKLPQPALHQIAIQGLRVGGEQALQMGIVDAVSGDEETTRSEAIATAQGLAQKAGEVLPTLRRGFYGSTIDSLRND